LQEENIPETKEGDIILKRKLEGRLAKKDWERQDIEGLQSELCEKGGWRQNMRTG
jgi:hypothetical protein